MRGIKNLRMGFFFISLIIVLLGTAQAVVPTFTDTSSPQDPTTIYGSNQDFDATTDIFVDFIWYIDGVQVDSTLNDNFTSYSNATTPIGIDHNVTVTATNGSDTVSYRWDWTVNAPPSPTLDNNDPAQSFSSYDGISQTFSIVVDQNVDVEWFLDGNSEATSTEGPGTLQYTNISPVIGNDYNVTVFVNNPNGSDSYEWTWDVVPIPAPSITRDPPGNPTSEVNQNMEFSITIDQPVNITWLINGTSVKTETLQTSSDYDNSTAPIGTYNVTVNVENVNGTDSTTWIWTVTPAPVIFTTIEPASSNPTNLTGETINFEVEVNQGCEIEWFIDGDSQQTDVFPVTSSTFSTSESSTGEYTVTAVATNLTSTAENSTTWTWKVNPAEFFTGNRIWDEDAGLSDTYTWTPQTFSGFYYNLDNDEGKETLTIEDIGWTLDDNNVVYNTEPISVKFEQTEFGEYYVIGFMADRYFAGYKDGSLIGDSNDNLLDDDRLSKVLIDSDKRQSLRSGNAIVLEEGYEFRIVELDITGKQALVGLFKDGTKLKETVVSEGSPFVYEDDGIPLIGIHIDTVFAGMETSSIIIDGIFQISDQFTEVENGDSFGLMEVTAVSSTKITMKNDDSISLSRQKGKTFNLMGKINIEVGDDSNTLRFAPVVDTTEPGTYELRGTVTEEAEFTWTPLNFVGLLYDLDTGFGDETLTITRDGRSVDDKELVYTTRPITINPEYSEWGTYQSIGFMGEKYFAGYMEDFIPDITSARSLIAEERLSKILIDDDKRRTMRAGNSITLEEGYSLGIEELSRNGDLFIISLSKDGDEIKTDILGEGEDFYYEKDVGGTDIPIIIAHVDSIFLGFETSTVIMEGVFQISEDFTTVESGDSYGKMDVTEVSDDEITMKNDNSFSLSKGETIDIMGDIKIKVADDDDIRFYPFLEVIVEEPIYLELEIPDSVFQNEEMTITVTSEGDEIEDASITFGDIEIGSTDSNGELIYTPTETGTITVTAAKPGYESDSREIEVLFQPKVLEISAPLVIDKGDGIVISVSSEGDPIGGASVKFGSIDLGTTPSNGNISYTPEEAGTFTISVSKSGYQDASQEIDVTDPSAKLVFTNLTIEPGIVQPGQIVNITAEAANFGTIRDSDTAILKINGKTEDTRELLLGPGESVTLSFTANKTKPGTYRVELNERTGTFKVAGKGMDSTAVIVLGIIAILGTTAIIYSFYQGTLSTDIIVAKLQAFQKYLKQLFEK